jgi:hypothetical protein
MRFRLAEKLSSQIWAGHVNMKFALFGSIAQSVELRTHKPSVPSSSLGRATTKNPALCGVVRSQIKCRFSQVSVAFFANLPFLGEFAD